MAIRLFFIGVLLSLSVRGIAQITVDTSYQSVTLMLKIDSGYRSLTFRRAADSDTAIYLNYFKNVAGGKLPNLREEVGYIRLLWDSAVQIIPIRLTSANIGYPLQYEDVLNSQIKAFKESEAWQAHVSKNGKTLDYSLLRSVMLEAHVYGPFEDFLKARGYAVVGLPTEKHGFIPKEKLKTLGEKETEIIPIPYMVWLSLKKE